MSYAYFINNPYFKRFFTPRRSCGVAINGTDVESIGTVQLKFRLADVPMTVDCKVTRGLMDPVILGFDWFCKYGIKLDAEKGEIQFGKDRKVPLIPSDVSLSGAFYRISEDLTLPPNSKVHANVQLALSPDTVHQITSTVVTEPFSNTGANYWAARTCSNVHDDKFRTEFINPSKESVKLEAGHFVGYAQFVDEKFDEEARGTEMYCSYRGDDPGYESGFDSEEEDGDEEIECDPKPKGHPPTHPLSNNSPPTHPSPMHPSSNHPPANQPPSSHPSPTDLPTTHPPDNQPDSLAFNSSTSTPQQAHEIPSTGKPLKASFSSVAGDVLPDECSELKELVEEQRKGAFSQHDRDYGKTTLIQYKAGMKDRDQTPLAQPPYRTRPDLREVIDRQAHEMIADGLVGHSTSPYSAPILLAKKKCGGWRFLTDFRKVNECCNKVVYPLPRIEDSIQRLQDPKFFTTLDFTKGFWANPHRS